MKYTEEHEWLQLDGDIVTVGITEHATDQLGEIVFVELPEVGTETSRGDEVVVIESVKAASEIVAPLDGEIVEINETLVENPALVNENPLEAWFFKIKISETSAYEAYMDEAAYKAMVS
jgi:glycine cleavage system H protein